jgi:cyclophilin family peptidyl-prolyl cis-trans isomerase
LFHRLRLTFAIVVLVAPGVVAQTVRFETNAGNFDLVLNPTNDPLLQGNVDNLLQYVTSGRYDNTVINRAATGFVLQMGVFKSPGLQPASTVGAYVPIEAFPPVIGVPAAELFGISNTAGMVGFALSGDGMGGTDQDSAKSSFYVNLSDNSFLDNDFTVFAVVPDMTTINTINALNQLDYTADPNSGADPGNLAFTDVPLLANGDLVVISRAFVVPEPSVCVLLGYLLASGAAFRRRPSKFLGPPRNVKL